MIWLLIALLISYLALLHLYPIKWVKARRSKEFFEPPDFYVYSYEFHIHTQFSYDSLGKPEDIKMSMSSEDIDYAIITDHDTDAIKNFCDEHKMIAGVERKITDQEGKILGDLIEIDNLKVIAHPFKEKYRWKLSRDKEYILEIINLKDALLENKFMLFLHLLPVVLLLPIFKERSLSLLQKVIDIEKYACVYLKEGWDNPVIGGLDHHVKIYIREVGMRFLFPNYKYSFMLMRNFLLSKEKISSAKELINAIKRGITIVSFLPKPSLVWRKGKKLFVQTPYENSIVFVEGTQKNCFEGSCASTELNDGVYVVYAYRYLLRIGRLYLGVRPLFITALEVRKDGDALT
ncbi:PHP domain-containing protein [Hydrogenobacter hydrogenophilus]|uniref:Predicted metal-dependent phosphoesterase TrpH, contains PHP domain n=1 Tax=Hydrogenobacter hydrogenophilus TaxID=35835 RepID=A0A285NZW7_9AQUI|nr:PHP domain-containing protein [Hydrogenobacter hydrogenophilus]SNZ14483.1 Predicted metal-dependent phosphoesterase TrpH, contains PHP domain [Hydrogenobacter hydrogenophilus]